MLILFLAFLDKTSHLKDTRIGIFCCTVLPDSKETEHGSGGQEASPLAGKNTDVVLVPCCALMCVTKLFFWCGHSWGPWVSFVTTNEFSVRIKKKILRGSLPNELKACLPDFWVFCLDQIAILSNVCTPDKFESHYSLKHSLINIPGLCSNFVGWESFLESSTSDILALCETNLEDANDYSNFSVKSHLPLIWKDSITHMQGLAVYLKERLSFA